MSTLRLHAVVNIDGCNYRVSSFYVLSHDFYHTGRDSAQAKFVKRMRAISKTLRRLFKVFESSA